MSSDLIFSVLPREGKVAIEKDELKVKQVEKEAKLRELNDEEKALNTEERDAREKYHNKSSEEEKDKDAEKETDKKQTAEKQQNDKEPVDPELPSVDEQGRKHLDIYI
ncbi:hypothetical protein Q4574_08210 [Aliiglaciecola sp. 3_MG-2023]|uniref:hypothetical protein n=1 Tax=Aliiglaciecola sp. 3_MG-2023 TaxID=3062644 RepID=UPI0026E1F7FE|nr:hypothetical protein [Aliiglaciecola sp. 3_MG-2023]MDO6693265.1 hypothetical protein [Aliiglaciecola sp. 3_MG-2023]